MPISNDEWNQRLAEAAAKARAKHKEMVDAANSGPLTSDVFDSIAGFATALTAMMLEAKAMKKELRKEKRRESYAKRKSLGLIKTSAQRKVEKEAKRAAEIAEQREQDSYVHESCYCHASRMPPCGWCTREANEEANEEEDL